MGSKTSYEWMDLAPGAEVSEEAERFMRKGILEVYGGREMHRASLYDRKR